MTRQKTITMQQRFFRILLITFFAVVVLMFVNNRDAKVSEDKTLPIKLAELNENRPFKLIELTEKQNWNQMIIIQPYGYSETQKPDALKSIDLPVEVEKAALRTGATDKTCMLLFFDNDQLLGYSIINRNVADFGMIDTTQLAESFEFSITDNRKVISLN
jgi:hypothetical protein